MANATDLVAVAAIAVGTAGSVALCSLALPDRATVVERNVVVRVTPPPTVDLQVEPPPPIETLSGELRIRHVPYIVYERRIDATVDPREDGEARIRIQRGPVLELQGFERPAPTDRENQGKRRPGGP